MWRLIWVVLGTMGCQAGDEGSVGEQEQGTELGSELGETVEGTEGSERCEGDTLEMGVGLSNDMDAFRQRWDANEDLLRVLIIAEPL
jgi:hypothetical protein